MLTRDLAQHLLTEVSVHQFSAFASDLIQICPQFKHGDYPDEIKTELGNGQPFCIIYVRAPNGEIEHWCYRQEFGNLVLKVFND